MNKTMQRFGMAGALVLAGMVAAYADEKPAAAVTHWDADPTHASVGFRVEHMVISKVNGQFKDFAGSLELDGDKLVALTGTIQATSVDTGMPKRDEHLRSPEFFDVAQHPVITLKSSALRGNVLVGDLTMHGITKSVELACKLTGPIEDPWKNTRYGLELTGKIDRRDFGLTWSKALDAGGLVVGNDVDLAINVEFIKK